MTTPQRSLLAAGLCLLVGVPGRAQWAEEQKLLASDGVAGDFYGWSVDVSGDVALVGAWGDDDAGGGSGAAYVYRYDAGSGQWIEAQKLTASDTEGGQNFGWAVALDGDVAVVGAGFDDDNGPGAGAAYVFRYDDTLGQWAEEQKLTASDGTATDRFGHAVAVEGDVAVIGAAQDDDLALYAGSAYVFRYDPGMDTWTEEQKLVASDGVFGDNLGAAVSISGDVILLGAETDDLGLDAGAAYVFRYDTGSGQWIEAQKLLASDGEAAARFGGAVAVDGEVTLIGAELDFDQGLTTGSAYVFRYDAGADAWVEERKLLASDGAAFDNFGFSVALDGETALVGAFVTDAAGLDSGAVYRFRYDDTTGEWTEEEKLVASDGETSDYFGVSVALDGDAALVGAEGVDDRGDAAGASYVFRNPKGTAAEPGAPERFALAQNAPNPFARSTVIAYALPEAGAVRLAVYDVLGREVAVLVDGPQPAGRHAVTWEAGPLPSGLYVYRLDAGRHTETRTMLLVK
jgi:hypothetical protein